MTLCKIQRESSGELGANCPARLPGWWIHERRDFFSLWPFGICRHQESKMPSGAEPVCILPCSPAPARQQLLATSAQLLLPSRFTLCPELPSHTAGTAVGSTEGCLKSLFETRHGSGKTYLLLHPTFPLVTAEGISLGGLTLVLRLIFIGLLVPS